MSSMHGPRQQGRHRRMVRSVDRPVNVVDGLQGVRLSLTELSA